MGIQADMIQQFSLLCDTSLSPQPPFESYALLTSFLTLARAIALALSNTHSYIANSE